jgi:hypothetical protein
MMAGLSVSLWLSMAGGRSPGRISIGKAFRELRLDQSLGPLADFAWLLRLQPRDHRAEGAHGHDLDGGEALLVVRELSATCGSSKETSAYLRSRAEMMPTNALPCTTGMCRNPGR